MTAAGDGIASSKPTSPAKGKVTEFRGKFAFNCRKIINFHVCYYRVRQKFDSKVV